LAATGMLITDMPSRLSLFVRVMHL